MSLNASPKGTAAHILFLIWANHSCIPNNGCKGDYLVGKFVENCKEWYECWPQYVSRKAPPLNQKIELFVLLQIYIRPCLVVCLAVHCSNGKVVDCYNNHWIVTARFYWKFPCQDVALIGSVRLTVPSEKISKERNTEAWFDFVQGESSGVARFYEQIVLFFFRKIDFWVVL